MICWLENLLMCCIIIARFTSLQAPDTNTNVAITN
jgi:hypothetical protein